MSTHSHLEADNNNIYAGLDFDAAVLSLDELKHASVEMLRPYVPALFPRPAQRMSRRVTRASTDLASHISADVENSLTGLVATICDGYHQNIIYHGFSHAVDVTHAMFLCITEHAVEGLNDRERFYLLLACLCHDLGHFGMGNKTLNEGLPQCSFTTQHSQCLHGEGCKPSIMEFFHLEKAIEIIDTHEFFTFDSIAPDVVGTLKVWMGDLILATDLANQAYFLNSVIIAKQPLEALPGYNLGIKRPSPLLLLLIKLADLGNVFRPFHIAKKWTEFVMIEASRADATYKFLVDKKVPQADITEERMLRLCQNPNPPVILDADDEAIEKRMQWFAQTFAVPNLIALGDLNRDIFKFLCKGLAESLGASRYTDIDFITEMCPELDE